MTESARIFLGEDDPAMRRMLRTFMTRSGFDVLECADGTALIREIERTLDGSSPPQVIVSDVQMPGANGLQVVHVAQRCLPTVPVILITAFGDERTHRRARELGAMAVLDKPFELRALRDLIVRALAEAR